MKSNKHDWSASAFAGCSALDIYLDGNDDLVIRMQGKQSLPDQFVIIPRYAIGQIMALMEMYLLRQ